MPLANIIIHKTKAGLPTLDEGLEWEMRGGRPLPAYKVTQVQKSWWAGGGGLRHLFSPTSKFLPRFCRHIVPYVHHKPLLFFSFLFSDVKFYAYDVTEGRPAALGVKRNTATCVIAKHAARGANPASHTAGLARPGPRTEKLNFFSVLWTMGYANALKCVRFGSSDKRKPWLHFLHFQTILLMSEAICRRNFTEIWSTGKFVILLLNNTLQKK